MRQTTVIHFRIAKAWLTISGVVQVLLGFLTIPGIPTKIPNLQYWTTRVHKPTQTSSPAHPSLLASFTSALSPQLQNKLVFLLSDKKFDVLHENTARTSTIHSDQPQPCLLIGNDPHTAWDNSGGSPSSSSSILLPTNNPLWR